MDHLSITTIQKILVTTALNQEYLENNALEKKRAGRTSAYGIVSALKDSFLSRRHCQPPHCLTVLHNSTSHDSLLREAGSVTKTALYDLTVTSELTHAHTTIPMSQGNSVSLSEPRTDSN